MGYFLQIHVDHEGQENSVAEADFVALNQGIRRTSHAVDFAVSRASLEVVFFYPYSQLATALLLSSAGPDYGPCTAEVESVRLRGHHIPCPYHYYNPCHPCIHDHLCNLLNPSQALSEINHLVAVPLFLAASEAFLDNYLLHLLLHHGRGI